MTVTGINLTGATSVKLSTYSSSFTIASATRITAKVPVMPSGNYRWQSRRGTATSTGYFRKF